MVSCKESVTELLSNREDLRRRLDSKSAIAEYLGCMFDCSSYLLANEYIVSELLTCVLNLIISNNSARLEAKDSRRKQLRQSDRGPYSKSIDVIASLLQILAKYVSQVPHPSTTSLFLS